MKFRSTKLIDGFSTCFRQEKAHPSHCALLHGYALSFELYFEGELDERNWVMDFGFMKSQRTLVSSWQGGEVSLDQWFKETFDHTVIVAEDDTQLSWFEEAHNKGILRLITMPQVGCERFAELVFLKLTHFLLHETKGRVWIVSVRCIENNKNSAIVCQ